LEFLKDMVSAMRWRRDERRLAGAVEDLPRRSKPLHVNFCFHAENIADGDYWPNFLDFVTRFHEQTSVKAIACVVPAVNPLAQAQMDRDNTTSKEYAARIHALRRFCEIGYHGHFFARADSPGAARAVYDQYLGGADTFPYDVLCKDCLVPVGKPSEDGDAVAGRFAEEMEWFTSIGIRPRVYAAGMWFLSKNVVTLIEDSGFEVDTSVRQGHSHPMGGTDLHASDIPGRGDVFLLPPRKRVIEIQSIFYPVQHPLRQLPFLREILACDVDEDRFAVFPSHETEVLHYRRELARYVDAIHKLIPGVRWSGLDEMLRHIRV